MALIEDYGLIGDLQIGRAREPARLHRLALPSAVRLARRSSRRLLGDPGERPLDDPAGRRDPQRDADATVATRSSSRPSSRPSRGRSGSIDFMPPRETKPDVVRIVEGVRGRVEMTMELVLRFDYGSIVPWVRNLDGTLVGIAGPDAVALRTPVELEGRNLRTFASFTVAEGDRVPVRAHVVSVARGPPGGDRRRGGARRHGLVLGGVVGQLHAHGPLGRGRPALAAHAQGAHVRADGRDRRRADDVAARVARRRAQLGLPLLLAARRDAHAPRVRPGRATSRRPARGATGSCARSPARPEDLQIMYGVAGERRLTELELPWLDGYEGSQPVRIGNGASDQLQLDVYGEVVDALYQARVKGLGGLRRRLGACAQDLRLARVGLAPGGRGHLGGARAAAPLHALEGHGVGRLRPRREDRSSELGREGPRRPLAGDAQGDSRGRAPPTATTPTSARSSSTTAPTGSTRACS